VTDNGWAEAGPARRQPLLEKGWTLKTSGLTVRGESLSFRNILTTTHLSRMLLPVISVIFIGLLPFASGQTEPVRLVQAPGNTMAIGTRLYVRLETPISTKTSHLHQAVTARVVREVTTDQGVWVPIGTAVTGIIELLIPTSDPSDHARLRLRFDQLEIPGHTALDLTAHLTGVENARETVLQDGTIQGLLAKEVPVSVVEGTLDRMGSAGGKVERVSDKALGKWDPSIDYPAGTDMSLTLDSPLMVDSTSPSAVATQLSPSLTESIEKLLVDAPRRAEGRPKRPGDPLNLVLVGSAAQIINAFTQAGWYEAKKLGARSAAGTVRAMTSNEGYVQAPVSQLYLYGRAEDMAFEKMLNTFSKRHHLRLWRSPVTSPEGRDIWLAAATHDVGIDIHLGVVSHAIDSDLDAERAKVGADLMASGLVAGEQLVERTNPLSTGKTATGGTWLTNGQLLVIELKATNAL
jgi:hypothetical protein